MYYSTGFLFNPVFSEVVLIRKTHPPWQKGLLNGVGGKVENEESAKEAMIREFEEEAGKHFEAWEPFTQVNDSDAELNFFVGCGDLNDVESKTDEDIEIHNPNEVQILETVPKVNWLVPMAETAFKEGKFYKVNSK